MKFYLALLFSLVIPAALTSFAPSVDDYLHENEAECSKQSGLDWAQIETIRKNRRVPNNEKANEWAKCMMQKNNVIKSDGTVNMDVKTITIPADTDTVIRAFPICRNKIGKDIADTARLLMNCYLQESDGLIMGIFSRPLNNYKNV